MRKVETALILPTPCKHLLLKHKDKCDFIFKLNDVSDSTPCQQSSALSRLPVEYTAPAKSVARTCQEKPLFADLGRVWGSADVRAQTLPGLQCETSCSCYGLTSSRHLTTCFLAQ